MTKFIKNIYSNLVTLKAKPEDDHNKLASDTHLPRQLYRQSADAYTKPAVVLAVTLVIRPPNNQNGGFWVPTMFYQELMVCRLAKASADYFISVFMPICLFHRHLSNVD